MTTEKLKAECLMLAQSFETLWAYYMHNGGLLFGEECMEAARLFAESLEELFERDESFKEKATRGMSRWEDVGDLIGRLKDWASASKTYPSEDGLLNRYHLFAFLSRLKTILSDQLGFSRRPPILMTTEEVELSVRAMRWRGHLPKSTFVDDQDQLVKRASESATIVCVGDIRRSQDLMTYSDEPEDFSKRMVAFITTTRELIEKHNGFFDKFTGDGFLAYFNESVCRAGGTDYVDCFLSFLQDIRSFCVAHFNEWSRAIRKLPDSNVGLAIGADHGVVRFHDLDNHLVAVGEAIVWASRMTSVAAANEVIVNNLLYAKLEGRPGLDFEPKKGQTLSGEQFLARSLIFGSFN
jgi:class 3 adenylate cyclase